MSQNIESKNNFFFIIVICLSLLVSIGHGIFFNVEEPTVQYSNEELKAIEGDIANLANLVIKSLKFKNFNLLSEYVHPTKGIRFSPYSYILSSDMILKQSDIKKINNNHKKFDWGMKSSNMEQINLTFDNYFDRYVYNFDFANANQIIFQNITDSLDRVDNIKSFYANSYIMEYKINQLVELQIKKEIGLC